MFVVVGALAIAGCGASPAFEEEGADPNDVVASRPHRDFGSWTPDPHDYATPFAMGQTWIGKYHCAQGDTDLALHIVDVDGANLRALFEFEYSPEVGSASPQGESGASGLFEMRGAWTVDRRSVNLQPVRWLRQPENYVTVALRGTVSVGGQRFLGVVDGPGCTHFALKLVR